MTSTEKQRNTMSRNRHILSKLLLFAGILLLAACRNNDYPLCEGTTSLQLIVRSAESTLKTRGVEDLDDNGSVTEEEIIVDGRRMYRLAVFLLEDNRVVSSTILEADDPRFGNNNTEATVDIPNLDYSKTYKLYAVANYGDYGTLNGNLSDVNQSNITNALTVSATSDNICNNSTPYPLTLTKDISLMPGANIVNGELVRTYARLRINVRNQSTVNDLKITKLSFPTKFTQRSANIFTGGGTANVSPVVTSNDAITPFVQNTIIPKISDEGSVSEKTIFDTYLLESTGGEYSYTLGLNYEGESSEELYTVNTNNPITNINNIKDGGLYIMYNTAGKFLYDNGDHVGAGTSYGSNDKPNHDYIWKFTKTSGNNYTIESMGTTGYFMQSSKVDGNKVQLTTSKGNYDYFTVSNSSAGNRIYFQTTTNTGNSWWANYYYLAISSNGNNVCGNTSSRRDFYLYEVTKGNGTASVKKEETIPIRIIDKNTGEASPLTAIQRNDLIDILVNVTYNEKTGNVEFEVSDWERVDGEVTFD